MSSPQKTIIIAEAGVNHNGSMDLAKELIEIAADAGADFVKFQTFRADSLTTSSAQKANYQRTDESPTEGQQEMLSKLELSPSDFLKLRDHCKRIGIGFLSTAFDEESLDFLVRELKIPMIKIPSGELTNGPFLLRIAQYKLPMILSTGMGDLKEVQQALKVLAFSLLNPQKAPKNSKEVTENPLKENELQVLEKYVTILHCTSEYPTPDSAVNLSCIATLRESFRLPVGYSDHSTGIEVPSLAVAAGSRVIEKHFTKDRTMPGPDHRASLDPNDLKKMVQKIREAEVILGSPIKEPTPGERDNRKIARRGIFAKGPIRSGETLTSENLVIKRPENGTNPMVYWDLLGKPAQRDYQEEQPISQ